LGWQLRLLARRPTPLGAEVLQLYRAVETTASAAGAEDIDRLHGLLADMATGK
jgi:hypothetical protein